MHLPAPLPMWEALPGCVVPEPRPTPLPAPCYTGKLVYNFRRRRPVPVAPTLAEVWAAWQSIDKDDHDGGA